MIAALLLLAALLRLRGITFGLPYPFAAVDEHLVTDHALAFAGGDLDPRYYAYPAGSFLLHAAADRIAWLCSPHESFAEFAAAFWVAPQHLLLVSRGVTLACALLAVWACGRIASEAAALAGVRSGRRPAAWLASGALALSLLHAANSRWTTVDAPLLAAAAIGLAAALRHLRRGSAKTLVVSAVAIGLAASFKYYGALFALALATAVVARAATEAVRPDGARFAPTAVRRLLGAAVVTALAFLAMAPYTLLDFATFAADFAKLRDHMEKGHFGHDPNRSGAAVYAAHLLSPQVGGALLTLAAMGLLSLLLLAAPWRAGGRAAAMVLLLPALVHFALIARFRSQPVDYLLPLLPALVALAGVAAARVAAALAPRVGAGVARTVVALLALPLLGGGVAAWQQGSALLRPDNRVLLRAWIEARVEPGALVAADTWLDLPLTVECLEQMRDAKASGVLVPQRRPRDEPLVAIEAKLAAARARTAGPAFDFAYLSPIEIGLRDQLFPLLREHGARWLVLDGSRAARAARSGGALLELAEWYRRHLEGPQVVARFGGEQGASGPPLAVLDLTLPEAPSLPAAPPDAPLRSGR